MGSCPDGGCGPDELPARSVCGPARPQRAGMPGGTGDPAAVIVSGDYIL